MMEEEYIFQYVPEGNADIMPNGMPLDRSYAEFQPDPSPERFQHFPSPEEIEEARRLKTTGNDWFKRKDYWQAIMAYTQSIVSSVD